MPILHVQYDGQGQTADGKIVKIPAAAALQQRGPIVQVMIGIAQTFAVGRDYLQHCTLHYNGITGAITLSI